MKNFCLAFITKKKSDALPGQIGVETPNPKPQIPSSKSQIVRLVVPSGFANWDLFGVWHLEFGISADHFDLA
jgi:hypothetical protein